MISFRGQETLPSSLLEYVESRAPGAVFLLRTVLVRDVISKELAVLASVLREGAAGSAGETVFRYGLAILIEKHLTTKETVHFLQRLASGVLSAGEHTLSFPPPSGCEVKHVAVENYWMPQAGVVYSIQTHGQLHPPHNERLVAVGAPYYPDVFEAARHWLGLRTHNGSSDGSNGHFQFLAPETRAYICDVSWPGEVLLELGLAGSLVSGGSVKILGACWIGKSIYHLQASVVQGKANMEVPLEAERLELLVLDQESKILDFHQEDLAYANIARPILGLRRSQSSTAALLQVLAKGENVRAEFKEFLELPRTKAAPADKDKLQQVLKTVVAFANTEGGTIYFGVNDSCEVVGAEPGVAKSGDGTVGEAAVNAYMGALRAKVRDFVYPSVDLRTTSSRYDDRLVISLEVTKSEQPTCLVHDKRLYVRNGSNNVVGAPADWKAPESPLFGRIQS